MKKKNKTKNKSTRKHKRLSTSIVLKYLSQRREPANTKAIAETLGRVGKEGRQETFEILEQLRDEGKVSQLSKHRWAMKHAIQEHRGRVVGHVDGHGYVLTDETREKVFLRSHEMREVLHNDIVNVRIVGRDRRHKLFGQIVDVIERGNLEVVGRYYNENNLHFVVPDDQRIGQDIFVLPEHTAGAETGQVVSVKITKHPTKHFQPVGEIVDVLGDYLAPGMEIEIAIRKHQLPYEWPEAVVRQIDGFSETVSEADKRGRTDIRDLPLVTIDGEDARDFDDAVYCEPLNDGKHRLVVAIADVSSYVKEHSPLDLEAWQRGTSVYFPNNVIPMLPEILSNGLCSLKPEVDRLCFVCDMVVDREGEIESYDFYQAVMHSHARLTYTQVAALVAGDATESSIAPALHAPIKALYALSKRLGARRRAIGTIEFEIPEPIIIFDDERKIERVEARERNDAHRLIEECMLAANICASLMLNDSNAAGIYRVHDAPDEDKIADARTFLRQFKLLLPGGDTPGPQDFSKVMKEVDDPLTAKIVQTALLRSMKQARYDVENNGHFALNFDSYTHFTSPIRRYPDLLVHRQIRRLLTDPELQDSDEKFIEVEKTAEQASSTERRAEAATREAVQWLKCEFMSHKIGEKLHGVVSSVTEFGLFVELEEFYVDGLVHITSLGQDYYRFDSETRRLIGEHSGRVYTTGDRLEVQVARVDMDQGRIDFALTDIKNEKFRRGKRSKSNQQVSGHGKHHHKGSKHRR
ncbi:ribonuclease R [Arenicella chitinivorans]|uniref:Ribonuclease R n=1 Tax=Arenicella chitinivorans TaxID=1329800 RepID=A0A918VT01_9GAMM|nr:ribonuclease R [Arenicella chitinivorans]GHA21590.1 ribonuclease R [Arenicella chitinivorans]